MDQDVRQKSMTTWLSWLFAISYLALGSLVPFLALVLTDRGVDGFVLTAALAALPVSRLICGPVWSVLADRYQAPTRMVRIGAAMSAIGAVMLWLAAPGWMVVLAMFVLAIGRAPAGPVLDGLTLKSLSDRAEYGRVRRWGSLGFMVGAVGVGWLVDHTEIGPIEIAAAASIIFLFVSIFMPSTDTVERTEILPALRVLGKDRFVRWMIPAAAFHFAPHLGNTSFIAVHADGLGLNAIWAGWAIAGGVTIEVLLMGKSKALLHRLGAERLFLLAIGLAIPRWILMTMVTGPIAIVLVNAIHGITFGVFWIAGVALMSARAPKEVTTSAQALFALAVGGFGSTLGVVGASWVVTTWGTSVMYSTASAVGCTAFFCAAMAVRK